MHALKQQLRSFEKSRDLIGYLSVAEKMGSGLDYEKRLEWLRTDFIDGFRQLLADASHSAEDADAVFNAVSSAIDLVTLSNRGRIYIVDASAKRLLCRKAWGPHKTAFKNELVSIDDEVWRVASVFQDGIAAFVNDTQASNSGCHHELAARHALKSCWLFPIFAPWAVNECLGTKCNQPRVGVLCVDNPRSSNGSDHNATEQSLIGQLLEAAAEPLQIAKGLADRKDLLDKLSLLLSFNNRVVGDHPESDILNNLFQVVTTLQPNISLMFVRLVRGYNEDQLGFVGCWPNQFKAFFERPENNVIKMPAGLMQKADEGLWLFIKDVCDLQERRGRTIIELDKFLERIALAEPSLPIKSLLSFRIESNEKLLGVCNFFTSSCREFLTDELETLSAIVAQLSIGLHTNQLLRNQRRQIEGQELLHECIQLISDENADATDVADRVTRELHRIFEARYSSCAYFDTNSSTWELVAEHPQDLNQGDRTERFSQGITDRAIESREPVVLTEGDENWSKYVAQLLPGIRTSACVPIKASDRSVIGAFVIDSELRHAFTKNDVGLMETILDHVPVAINAVRQMHALRTKVATEEWGASAAFTVHKVVKFIGPMPSLLRRIQQHVAADPIPRDKVSQDLDTAYGLANDLLDVADRLNSSLKQPESCRSVQILPFLRNIIEENQKANQWPDIDIVCVGNESIQTIVDLKKLEDISECLVDNAVTYAKQARNAEPGRPTQVRIEINTTPSEIHIDVIDTGRGVRKSVRGALLVRILSDSQADGNGIGLWISGAVAKRLGGKIVLLRSPDPTSNVKSSEQTTFRLVLPIRL